MHKELMNDFTSPRVKSLAFHPTKPVLLTSHHTGTIFAHDLHLSRHINTFVFHDGPVRCLSFHPSTDIFVSGGDDTKVVLWSYGKKKAVHVFKGHTDYIRSVHFHPTQPIFLSSSDDMTIKVWNFQSLKMVVTISGHTHYVMGARFMKDCIVSVSLDQNIRIWDCSQLLGGKKVAKGRGHLDDGGRVYESAEQVHGSLQSPTSLSLPSFLGAGLVSVRQIIEAHDRGINWVSVDEERGTFLTCGDDMTVKVWEMGETCWERESIYTHTGNVSSCTFVKESVVSVGEDGLLCVTKNGNSSKTHVDTRFWAVGASKDGSLFAVGHDSGVKIYTTERRGVIYDKDLISGQEGVEGDFCVVYERDGRVFYNDFKREIELYKGTKETERVQIGRVNSYNINNIDIPDSNDETEYIKSKGSRTCSIAVLMQNKGRFIVVHEKKVIYKGSGKGLIVGNYILSEENGEIRIVGRVTENSIFQKQGNTNTLNLSINKKLHTGSITEDGVLLKEDDLNMLNSLASKKLPTSPIIIYSTPVILIKYKETSFFVCSQNSVGIVSLSGEVKHKINIQGITNIRAGKKYLALISKHRVEITTHNLASVSSFEELTCITDGIFVNNAFLYSTTRHIKYIVNRSRGIIRSMEKEIYLLALNNNTVFYIGKEGLENVEVDLSEFRFKEAVERKDTRLINEMVKKGGVLGKSMVTYLVDKGMGEMVIDMVGERKIDIYMDAGRFEECYKEIIEHNKEVNNCNKSCKEVNKSDNKVNNLCDSHKEENKSDKEENKSDKEENKSNKDENKSDKKVNNINKSNKEENNINKSNKEENNMNKHNKEMNNINKSNNLNKNIKINSECLSLEQRGLLAKLYRKCLEKENLEVAEKCLWALKDFQSLFMFFLCCKQVERIKELKFVGDETFKACVGVFLDDPKFVEKIILGKSYERNLEAEYLLENSNKENDKENEEEKDEENDKGDEKDKEKDKGNEEEKGEENDKDDEKDEDKEYTMKRNEEYTTKRNEDKEYKIKSNDGEAVLYQNSDNEYKQISKNQFITDKQDSKDEYKKIYVSKDEDENRQHSKAGINNEEDNDSIQSWEEEESVLKAYKQEENKDSNNNNKRDDKSSLPADQQENESLNTVEVCKQIEEMGIKDNDEENLIEKNSSSNKTDNKIKNNKQGKNTIKKINNLKFDVFVLKGKIYNEEMNCLDSFLEALELTTKGKFNNAISTFKEILFCMAHKIINNSSLEEEEINLDKDILKGFKLYISKYKNKTLYYKDLIKISGLYLSGLSVEKKKKKVEDPKQALTMSAFFASLPLKENHRILALSNFMVFSFKNGNFCTAVKCANELKNGKIEGTVEKAVNKILKSKKEGEMFSLGCGVFCMDSCEYESVYRECLFCGCCSSAEETLCMNCEIGVLSEIKMHE